MTTIQHSRHLCEVAEEAARAVRDPLLEAFRSNMSISFKRDLHDAVTVHDKAAEEVIIRTIMEQEPDSSIVGEEGGMIGHGSVEWHVDPIDGTSNFSRGLALWCVSIAAVVDGEVVAAVIFDPVADDLFSADLSGAFRNGDRLHSAAAAQARRSTVVGSYPVAIDVERDGDRAHEYHETLLREFFAVRNIGSGALCLAFVAAGWADVTFNVDTNSWDVAAGSFILEQAGGHYIGYNAGVPTKGPDKFRAPDYIAYGAGPGYPVLEDIIVTISRDRAAARRPVY